MTTEGLELLLVEFVAVIVQRRRLNHLHTRLLHAFLSVERCQGIASFLECARAFGAGRHADLLQVGADRPLLLGVVQLQLVDLGLDVDLLLRVLVNAHQESEVVYFPLGHKFALQLEQITRHIVRFED